MSQTARRDANGVLSVTAMLGGTKRRSSRIAAQGIEVGRQEVSNIREPAPPRRSKRLEDKAAKVNPTRNLIATNDKPFRTPRERKQIDKPTVIIAPSAENDLQTRTKEQTQRRKGRPPKHRAAQKSPRSRPHPRKAALRKADPAVQVARIPATKDIDAQREGFHQTGDQVQGDIIGQDRRNLTRAPLSRKALRQLEFELGPSDNPISVGSQVILLQALARWPF